MPSINRNHGAGVWREAAQSGGVPGVAPIYFVYDGADIVLSVSGREELALYQLDGDDYVMIDLTNPGPTSGDYYDVDGTLWTVAGDTIRLRAVNVRSDTHLY